MNWKKRFVGYLNTPLLWEGTYFGIEQLKLEPIAPPEFTGAIPSKVRLGFLAEEFTFDYWNHHPEVDIICKNIQIEGNQQTIGEIDAVLRVNSKLIHTEIAYKFYLFDPEHGNNEIQHWIGPNRKDTLLAKLERIKEHQLPMIHLPETKTALSKFVDETEEITSKVWIKGQLFVPFGKEMNINSLNSDCIAGFYVDFDKMAQFSSAKFFLPTKQDWFLDVHEGVEWKDVSKVIEEIQPILERHFSPLLWKKEANGALSKMFIVWWNSFPNKSQIGNSVD